MSEELRYLVTCKTTLVKGCDKILMYQESEPVHLAKGDFYGGFSHEIRAAIIYQDHSSAQKVRNRIQKMYKDFPIKVITRPAKELFMARLV